MEAEPDVVVVGAGPAGAVSALVAARAGLDVVIVDRAGFPRDKACGDALVHHAIAVLADLGVDHVLEGAQPVSSQRSASIQDLGRRHDGVPTPPEHRVQVLPRRVLDDRLVESALDAGAIIVQGTAVALDQPPDDRPSVTIRSSTGEANCTLRPRFVVGADGATSRVAQLIGARRRTPTNEAFALRRYASAEDGELAPHLDFMIDLDGCDPAHPAYGWVFPTSTSSANVGVCLWGPRAAKRSGTALKAFLAALPRVRPDLPALVPCSDALGGFIRFDAGSVRRVVGDVVLVGDAAGLSEPSSGEGISFALRSGMLAGEAIIGACDGFGTLEAYDEAVSRELLPRLADGMADLLSGSTVASADLLSPSSRPRQNTVSATSSAP